MTVPTRTGLARVLRSLLVEELAAARGRRGAGADNVPKAAGWSEDSRITGRGPRDLGCDSLEALCLSSAVCEMFHLAAVGRHHRLVASDRLGEWLDIVEDGWRAGLGTVTFATSGTTGIPKRCTHRLAELCVEARHFAGLCSDRSRVLAFAPAHHIYGFLFTALLPDALGIECLDGDGATEALGALRPGDLIVAFPERWRWIARIVGRFRPCVHGVTSTAPCPRALSDALVDAGLAGLIEVYGSSETAGIGVRMWPEPSYRLLPRWRFASADTLADAAGAMVVLPDAIRRTGGETFVPTGRRDGAVQVGGVNVYPERVAAALRGRPGVADVAVRAMRPDEGDRLKAFVVADGTIAEAVLRDALMAWIAATTDAPSRPVDIRFGPRLPRNRLDKLCDW